MLSDPEKAEYSKELNDLRKFICLRKSEVYVKKQFQMSLKKLTEHGMHCLPGSYTVDVIDLSSTMTSH